jgi:hypothetical protein
MAEISHFHHARGLTEGCPPDLYDGRTRVLGFLDGVA